MRLFISGLLLLSTTILCAQKDSTKSSFLSHIFLPSDYGILIPTAPELEAAYQSRVAIEYRFNRINGLFIRGSLDTRATVFNVPALELPFIVKGKIKHTDLLLGAGIRVGEGKWRNAFLLQTGFGFYQYPTIQTNSDGNFGLEEGRLSGVSKFTFSTERYISKRTAITFDIHYGHFFEDSPFWKKNGNFGIAIGLTTGPF